MVLGEETSGLAREFTENRERYGGAGRVERV